MIKVIKASVNAGKTTKAIEIAVERANMGENVLFLNNEETQESLIEKIAEYGTDFGDGEIIVGEIDGGNTLSALQDVIHSAAIAAGKERKIDVMIIDFSWYTEADSDSQDRLSKYRSYLKRIEAVHEIDIYFTMQVIRKNKGVTRPVVTQVWKDTVVKSTKKQVPACFDNVDIVSIDVTKASPMIQNRNEQVIIYQDYLGDYVGKHVNFKFYGYKA